MTIDANKTDATEQLGDHAAHHNALAEAVNALESVVASGGIPSPENANVGDALVKKTDLDNSVEWRQLREVPDATDGTSGDVVTKTGAGEFAYGWRAQATEPVAWGAITKTWFVAGTSLPADAASADDGTVFIVYKA